MITCLGLVLNCNGKPPTSDPPSVVDPDTIPPVITNINRSPQNPIRYQPITISANVHDAESSQLHIDLCYNVFGDFTVLEAENVADSFYATIPGNSLFWGKHIEYYIQASDSSGNVSVSDTFDYDIPYFRLYLSPESDTINVGELCSLAVNLDGAEAFFSMNLDILFDSALVEIDTLMLSDDNLLGDGDILFLYQEISNGVSTGVGRTQTEEDDNVWGSGPLFNLLVIAEAEGTVNIVPQNILIYDDEGNECPIINNLIIDTLNINIL
ncbi:MAG: hypothetical protein GY839_07750 [candidate division Zixibacteria bacterium]|nr:hypothetical protein [candidate division Zixibacteria bacterium]